MKLLFFSSIFYFGNICSNPLQNTQANIIITNFNENCIKNYKMLMLMSWAQQVLPYIYYKKNMMSDKKDDLTYFEFQRFLDDHFLQDEKSCKTRIYKLFVENFDFFNGPKIDEFRQNFVAIYNADTEKIMNQMYDIYNSFMIQNRDIITKNNSLFTFYVLQYCFKNERQVLLELENSSVDFNVVSMQYDSKLKMMNVSKVYNDKNLLNNIKTCRLGIFIDPAFNYYDICYHSIYILHKMVERIQYYINYLFEQKIDIQYEFITPKTFLPIYTEKLYLNKDAQNDNNFFNLTWGLKKSIYDYFELASKLGKNKYLIDLSKFRRKTNINNSNPFFQSEKNSNEVETIASTSFNVPDSYIYNSIINLAKNLTLKIKEETIQIFLPESHVSKYILNDVNNCDVHVYLWKMCQIFFKSISLITEDYNFKYVENSFSFYTYMLNVYNSIKKEEYFTTDALRNFYDTIINKTIKFNLQEKPFVMSIVEDRLVKKGHRRVLYEKQLKNNTNRFFISKCQIHYNNSKNKNAFNVFIQKLFGKKSCFCDICQHKILNILIESAFNTILLHSSFYKNPTNFFNKLKQFESVLKKSDYTIWGLEKCENTKIPKVANVSRNIMHKKLRLYVTI